VTLRLLLDENLSERLIPLLSARFENPQHVRLLELGGADDLEIWELARRGGYLLDTKDEDFLRLSLSRGFPPKVICLGTGNAGNARSAALLLNNLEAIEAFTTHPEAGFLLLRPEALSS
jgi:predicted nuclease of predicted toxin-antitoxin system